MSEPAGSEAAKFRLWVKSKGLALTRPEVVPEEEGHDMLDTPLLFVPTGTDKVSQPSPSPSTLANSMNIKRKREMGSLFVGRQL